MSPQADGFGIDIRILSAYVDGEITMKAALAARVETAPKGTN